jgi:hypothetical protein
LSSSGSFFNVNQLLRWRARLTGKPPMRVG